jgi:AbrB family looped-hinge helix DNA binding protein
MRVNAKGQVTIPIAMRKKLGLTPGTEVEFELCGDTVTVRKAAVRGGRLRVEKIIARARGTGSVNRDLTTDQIMAITRGWGEDESDR